MWDFSLGKYRIPWIHHTDEVIFIKIQMVIPVLLWPLGGGPIWKHRGVSRRFEVGSGLVRRRATASTQDTRLYPDLPLNFHPAAIWTAPG